LDISIRSGDIRAQSGKESEIGPKLGCFRAQNLLGAGPKFLDRRYKIEHAFEHDTQFRSNRPRDLGDFALKKQELQHNIRPSGNYRSGRPKNICKRFIDIFS